MKEKENERVLIIDIDEQIYSLLKEFQSQNKTTVFRTKRYKACK